MRRILQAVWFRRTYLNYSHASIGRGRSALCTQPISEFGLSDEDSAELLPSGRQTKLYNRIIWALFYMYKSGLLERPQHGLY